MTQIRWKRMLNKKLRIVCLLSPKLDPRVSYNDCLITIAWTTLDKDFHD